MPITERLGLLVIAVTLALCLSAGVAVAQNLSAPPPAPELTYPKLGSRLDEMATGVEEGSASAQGAAGQATISEGESVAVTIYLSGNVDAVVAFLEANGGSPRNVGTDYIEAYVPVSLLGETSEQPGVVRIREIVPPQSQYGPIPGQAAGVHRATAWNLDGNTGRGVKVGVIDLGFKGFRNLMGTELPPSVVARCYTATGQFSDTLADCDTGTVHGTAVAEAVLDIAPDVSLYITNPVSEGDLKTAVEWLVAQGVDIINQSLAWTFDGPGDGSSPYTNSPLKAVDTAVSGGILWVNAAGNAAKKTWFGPFSNTDNDDLHDFFLVSGQNDETIDMYLNRNTRLYAQLRWDDTWPGAARNVDLHLWRPDTKTWVAESEDIQNGGPADIPLEILKFTPDHAGNKQYGLVIALHEGSAPAWLHLTVWGTEFFDILGWSQATRSHSIASPAESNNAGLLAVGAAAQSSTSSIESFSSRGPTPDNRVKPDLVGADRSSLHSYSLFTGTSQSSPHVAGLAALVLERFPDLTPAQVASFLKNQAAQRTESSPNNTDPNNIWGHGFAQLPTPVACRQALIENGTLTNETWSAYCPTSGNRSGSYARDYTFTLAASTAVTIDLTSSVDTYLNLWSGTTKTGSPLHSDDNGGSGTNARISQTLAAGSYIFEATTAQAGTTGSYSLTVAGLPAASAGVTISKTAVALSENDGVGTYTVRLNSAPTADVTITVTGEANTALVHTGTNNPATTATLTFTQTNYATPQTVTVSAASAADDDIDNSSAQTATISHTVSATGGYTGVTAAGVSVTLTDDDASGITVSTSGLTVAENTGTATYTVKLNSKPSANVTVTPASSDTSKATVSGALTFTTTNWNTAQTVTVTGVDDASSVLGGRTATISHSATSTDANYTIGTGFRVTVGITENDPGVVASKTTLTVAENATATYTVVLTSQPSASVTVTPVSSATAEATVSGALTFTTTNWNIPQIVTVTGVNDTSATPAGHTATVTHTVGNTGGYGSVTTPSVAVSLADDDAVTLGSTTLTVAENAGAATYTVVLGSQPSANVTVTPVSSDTSKATVSGALTFTNLNWNTAQTVTVTGVDDDIDSTRSTTITHTVSSTGGYTNVAAPGVSVTLTDNDTRGVTVSTSTLAVAENAGTATYTVVLDSQPTANVIVVPASSATAEATVSGALTFTSATWDTAQTVTVTGVNDTTSTPAGQTATISHTVNSPGGYTNVTAASVTATLIDDDSRGVTVSTSTLTVAENAGTATYTVKLNSKPAADVTLTPTSSDEEEATVSGALTFTPTTWNTTQTVTVTGVDDTTSTPVGQTATITHTVSNTGGYTGVTAASVAVTLIDDDSRGVTVAKQSVTVAENGGTATYTVKLNSKPAADVTLTPTSSDTTEATVSGALTFTTTTWNTAQTVTVTGVNDYDIAPGGHTATIRHAVSGGYTGVTVPGVTVTLPDDDAVIISKTTLPVAENATATYTVVLKKAPTANATVTVTPVSSDEEEATVSGELTFTPDTWNTDQTVTVTGVNDDAIVLAGHTATISHTVSKTGGYTNVTVDSVAVTLTDDDAVTVNPTTLPVPESGTATYAVKLNKAPTANVTVTPTSDDTGAATVSGPLIFTNDTWNTDQTVTVTGVDDDIDNDSARSTTISHTVSKTGGYDNVTAASVDVTLTDDDTRGVTVSPTTLTVAENAGTATYTVKLTSEPTANVTVTPSSDDEGVADVSDDMLTFTADNWNTARTVTVTGVDDGDDSTQSTTITHTVIGGGYDNVNVDSVAVTLTDDGNPGNNDGRSGGGVVGGGGGGAEPEPAVVRGFFESPAPGAVVSGIDIIRGWSFADTRGVGIEQVELFLDRQRHAVIPCCSPRPDVAGNFPTAPTANAGQSGWGITTNWGNLTPGPHTLQVVVTSTDEGRWVSEVHPITVLKPGDIAFADRFSLAEAEARLEGNTLVLDGAVIGTATTEQELVARYGWQTGAQGLRLLASRPLQTARAQPGGIKRLLAGLWAWGRAWLRPGSVSADPGLARFYEAPAHRAQVAGIGLIRGWAFPVDETDAIATVTVDIDGGARRESAPCCSTRPDIAAEYPAQANALLSGWGAVTNYGNLAAGEHTLAVRITTTAGLAVTETHTVTVARLGGYAFVDRFALSGAEVEIVGEEIILSGVEVRDSATQATQTIEVRLRWSRATQGLVIVDTAVMP